jgi:hypothetical protein
MNDGACLLSSYLRASWFWQKGGRSMQQMDFFPISQSLPEEGATVNVAILLREGGKALRVGKVSDLHQLEELVLRLLASNGLRPAIVNRFGIGSKSRTGMRIEAIMDDGEKSSLTVYFR